MVVFSALLLLLSSCSNAQTISTPQVDPWGPNSFRVRWAAQDYPLIESTYTPFVPQTTVSAISTFNKSSDVTSYVNGNLQINVDTTSGLITVIRISDSVTLMQQTALKWAVS